PRYATWRSPSRCAASRRRRRGELRWRRRARRRPGERHGSSASLPYDFGKHDICRCPDDEAGWIVEPRRHVEALAALHRQPVAGLGFGGNADDIAAVRFPPDTRLRIGVDTGLVRNEVAVGT